ncbi:hypothetical protein THAOC_09404 [Thalassiosira oceanica]|uniref:Uncharacterized protein n=1 Tax=Thalassiosira oceanica TaxID=159749 RepID=K0SWK8_THAOC|nr:hypothetical protein THAOC_09404 [Thalassiosira oceanica]|eukprot:EJK69349.1 hypothetical protein THAOC_09404 [Thalassiosira oceanica]
MPNSSTPHYDLAINPPYQVNYRAKRAGKTISCTKRRITFKFGFSSREAILSGATEGEARGTEHEVVLIWSHISGKRQLSIDGRVIHTSKAARVNTEFEYQFPLGPHMLKIIAHAAPPTEGSRYRRQFNLELDGMSFFRFKQIYQLGQGSDEPVDVPFSYKGNDETRDDVEVDPPVREVDVDAPVDLFDVPEGLTSPMTDYTSMPSLGSSTMSSGVTSYDEFAPVESKTDYTSISNSILGAYGRGEAASALLPPSAVENQSSSRALVPVSENQIDPVTKSFNNLVNLDDINSKPFQSITATNVQQGSNWSLVGRAPTLSEMRSISPASVPKSDMKAFQSSHQPQLQQPQQQHPMSHQYQGYCHGYGTSSYR